MVIKPSIGRMLWYHPPGYVEGEQPLAAVVAHVHSDRLVNVGIFTRNGKPDPNPPTSVPLVQEGDEVPANSGVGYCSWMPFQIGQAKAHAQAG